MKPIISHVTIGHIPACEFPLPWQGTYGGKLIQCGFLSLAAARKAAAACKHWNVRAVKGKCPIAHALGKETSE